MRALAVLGVLATLAGGGWLASRRLARVPGGVPTHVVSEQAFVRRVTAEGYLRAVQATAVNVPTTVDSFGPKRIAWIAQDGAPVKSGDVVARFDATEPEKQLREGLTELAIATAKLEQERIKSARAVDNRDRAAKVAGIELEQQRTFAPKDREIYSSNEVVEAEIDGALAVASQQHAESVKQIERKLAGSKAGVIAVEIQRAQLAITHARAALAILEVKAPHDGILVLQRGWSGELPRVGDELWPGSKVGEIPLLDAMEAEVFVLEVDASGIADGVPAEVVIEARPDRRIAAKAKRVDTLAKPRVPGVPVQYFSVVLELARAGDEVLKQGQRVRATLILDKADALVVPRQAVIVQDAKRLVYRRGAHGFEPVEVEIGPGTAGRVTIRKGLAAGDVIALRDPTTTPGPAPGSGGDRSGSPGPREVEP